MVTLGETAGENLYYMASAIAAPAKMTGFAPLL
jgi:hypothetical protein